MLPDTIALIILEALKLLNWQLANLPTAEAQAAAVRFDQFWAFWQQWLPKPPASGGA